MFSLFNPSNDMALASGLRQYSPPKRIQQMEDDLAGLASLWDDTPFRGPWGWSLATKRRYLQRGLAEEDLPSDEWLAEVRKLSSRAFACEYIRDLLDNVKDERLLGNEMQFHTELQTQWDGTMIFKSPWSSSGRGVFTSANLTREQVETRLKGFLNTQGGYVSDRFHADKALDFAMEFYVTPEHTVEFLGYSIFHTEGNGAYSYNLVDSQEQLQALIPCKHEILNKLVDYHKHHLGRTCYYGPAGIDMLTTATGRIHPCLEINFRMNMGILSLLLYHKYGAHATVQLTPPRASGFEARITDGRLEIKYKP